MGVPKLGPIFLFKSAIGRTEANIIATGGQPHFLQSCTEYLLYRRLYLAPRRVIENIQRGILALEEAEIRRRNRLDLA